MEVHETPSLFDRLLTRVDAERDGLLFKCLKDRGANDTDISNFHRIDLRELKNQLQTADANADAAKRQEFMNFLKKKPFVWLEPTGQDKAVLIHTRVVDAGSVALEMKPDNFIQTPSGKFNTAEERLVMRTAGHRLDAKTLSANETQPKENVIDFNQLQIAEGRTRNGGSLYVYKRPVFEAPKQISA